MLDSPRYKRLKQRIIERHDRDQYTARARWVFDIMGKSEARVYIAAHTPARYTSIVLRRLGLA